MSEATFSRFCAMCRIPFYGFRATWTDTCAECEPKVQAIRNATRNALADHPHTEDVADE